MRRAEFIVTLAALLAGCGSGADAGGASLPEEVDLAAIQRDGTLPHERMPRGVPRGFDWARGPRVGAGNTPGAFRAATGWGQAFSSGDADGRVMLQLRALQVLVCAGPQRQWQLVQRGPIEGRQFRADFAGNASAAAEHFELQGEVATVAFAAGSAFHFWPAAGRFELPAGPLCGVLVLVQARLDPNSAPGTGALVGLGADYWLDRGTHWDQYRTNRDIAIGRLRVVTPEWRWVGLSTAGDADLQRLHLQGYDPGACRAAAC